jgi:hypothetical protein
MNVWDLLCVLASLLLILLVPLPAACWQSSAGACAVAWCQRCNPIHVHPSSRLVWMTWAVCAGIQVSAPRLLGLLTIIDCNLSACSKGECCELLLLKMSACMKYQNSCLLGPDCFFRTSMCAGGVRGKAAETGGGSLAGMMLLLAVIWCRGTSFCDMYL